MATGTKSDPTRIQIADLSATHYDALARAVPQHLRAVLSHSGRSYPPAPPPLGPFSVDADADDDSSTLSPTSSACEYSIPVVYSSEVPSDDVTLLPLTSSELVMGSVDELAPLRDFRVRILPVLCLLPEIFGLHIVTYVLCELAGRVSKRATVARVPS
jgi:tRNA threonylcarbamoyladenosine dehydratase